MEQEIDQVIDTYQENEVSTRSVGCHSSQLRELASLSETHRRRRYLAAGIF